MVPCEETRSGDKNGKIQKVRRSEVQLYGASPSSCGYCPGTAESSLSYGVVSQSMSAEDYETLMLIGWRRSGTYFYKPIMYATCCPAYTIRLEASRFAISKKQRQVIRRIERYIESGSVLQSNHEGQVEQNKSNSANTSSIKEIKESELLAAKKSVSNQSKKDSISAQIDEFKKPNETEEVKMKTPAHVLECETVTAEFTTERYELYKKYQISVHGDDPCKITPSGFKRFLVESPLFDLSPSSTSSSSLSSVVSNDKELGATERKMKIVKPCTTEIHGLGLGMEVKNSSDINSNRKDKIKGVDNSINVEKEGEKGEKVKETVVWKYGSYHQLYRLDRRLVAVGVVDILPSGLSSVYLFYDPDEKLLSLGKYTAIKEIEFCVKNNLKYYYMGFYIHSCKKMKYKGEYEPSELLCPVALDWHAFKSSINYLNKYKFTPLNSYVVEEFEIIMDIENEKVKEKVEESEKDLRNTMGNETEKDSIDKKCEDNNDSGRNKSKIITNENNSNHTKDNQNNGKKSITNNEILDSEEVNECHHNNEDEKKDENNAISLIISPLEKMKSPTLQKFAPNFNFCPPCSTSSLPQEEHSGSSDYPRIRTMHTYVASSVFENLSRGKRFESVNEGENNHKNSVINGGSSSALKQKIVNKESKEDAAREELSRVPLDFGGGRRLYSVNDVKGREREFVATHLKEWVDLCGPKISPKVIVKF